MLNYLHNSSIIITTFFISHHFLMYICDWKKNIYFLHCFSLCYNVCPNLFTFNHQKVATWSFISFTSVTSHWTKRMPLPTSTGYFSLPVSQVPLTSSHLPERHLFLSPPSWLIPDALPTPALLSLNSMCSLLISTSRGLKQTWN